MKKTTKDQIGLITDILLKKSFKSKC